MISIFCPFNSSEILCSINSHKISFDVIGEKVHTEIGNEIEEVKSMF